MVIAPTPSSKLWSKFVIYLSIQRLIKQTPAAWNTSSSAVGSCLNYFSSVRILYMAVQLIACLNDLHCSVRIHFSYWRDTKLVLLNSDTSFLPALLFNLKMEITASFDTSQNNKSSCICLMIFLPSKCNVVHYSFFVLLYWALHVSAQVAILRWWQPNSLAWVRRREIYRPSDRRLSAKLVPTTTSQKIW
jgi:hypothetical protein